MQLRDHIFALSIHGGILLAICILVLVTSCGSEPPPPPEPDPVTTYFKDLQIGLDETGAETVTVIAVEDNSGVGEAVQRQVYQEILAQLHELESIKILEYPQTDLEETFSEIGIEQVSRLSPDDAIELASELRADSLLYASIESNAPDVHIKIYSAENGAIVFAETLQAWLLPISKEEVDLFGELMGTSDNSSINNAESDGDTSSSGIE